MCVCVCVVCQIVKYVPVLWLCQRADDVRRSSERGTVTTGRRVYGELTGATHALAGKREKVLHRHTNKPRRMKGNFYRPVSRQSPLAGRHATVGCAYNNPGASLMRAPKFR